MASDALRTLLAPRSVAIVGASEDPDKVGGRPVDYLLRFGFAGDVYPVNPNRPVVQGMPAYPDLASLPACPDAALIVVPGDAAVEAVCDCAAAGVGAAIVLASGFGETSAVGRAAQDRMTAVAREAGMRLVGPNCQGVTNFSNGAVLTFSTMYLEQPPADGPVAVISQSGSMSQVPYAMVRSRGIGVRYCAATGNEADVSAVEVAAAVALDPEVRLVLLYLETIREPFWLAELGRVAAGRGLPVVALKAGATTAGQVAARSHTGALANEDRVVDAYLERVGIYRAAALPDLLNAVELHLRPDWEPTGPRVAALTNSGASCVQIADAVVTCGLELARLEDRTVEAIANALPPFATPTNPVDLTGALLSNSRLFSEVLPLIRADPNVDSLVVALPVLGQGYDVGAFAAGVSGFAASGRPTVVVAPHPPAAAVFRERGLPVFDTEVEAVAALAQWWTARDRSARARRQPYVPAGRPGSAPGRTETLDEAGSLAVLAGGGVPVVGHELSRDADGAVAAWARLGGPVALKGCTARVIHKSDAGLVALGLASEPEIRVAYGRVASALHALDPSAPGVIVARMASGRRELMVGGRIDPVFGPVVIVGDGGAYVEALPDVQVLIPPLGADDVRRALARLRIAPLMAGVRGEPPWDVEAFTGAVVAVARLLGGTGGVVELDVNPLLVGSRGDGCVAVDAVVTRRSPPAH